MPPGRTCPTPTGFLMPHRSTSQTPMATAFPMPWSAPEVISHRSWPTLRPPHRPPTSWTHPPPEPVTPLRARPGNGVVSAPLNELPATPGGPRLKQTQGGMCRAKWRGPRLCDGPVARRRQAGSEMARSRARARLNWVSHGQRCGRYRVRRRAERVIRPARAKTRRLSVLVVTICSPRPMPAGQRARLCAITCTASQAALAAKRPDGRWLSPTPYLRSRMVFSISAWRRWSASSSSISPSRSVMKP